MQVGTTTITATAASGVSAECTVTVDATPVESVTLDRANVSLKATERVQLTASVAPETATNKTIIWSSSDETVATVSESGLVTALKVGTTTITATAASGVIAECTVTVEATPVESVTLNYDAIELRFGESFSLNATVYPDDATDKSITWSSSDSEVVIVDENGQVTAVGVKEGGAIVTATAVGGASASCHVTVLAPLATSIELDQTLVTTKPGDEIQLTATVLPSEASTQALEWSSSDEVVATVSSTGLVSILSEGEATITVSTTDGSNLSATCVIKMLSGIDGIYADDATVHDIYTVGGVLVRRNATRRDFDRLQPGFYIINGLKIFKR